MNRITLLVAAGAVATTMTIAPTAAAREACEPCTGHVAPTAVLGTSPYGVPLDALGGRTLAEHLTHHNAHRLNMLW